MSWFLSIIDENLEEGTDRASFDSLQAAITAAEELFRDAPGTLEWKVVTRAGQIDTMELLDPPAGWSVLIESERHVNEAEDLPRQPGAKN